jgi:preprotein translocase subunit SecY
VATSSTNPTATLGDMTRFAEMRKRLWFLLGALVVYRMGTFIPVPGIDAARFAAFFSTQNGTLLGMFNMFSGGALQRFSIFALNVMPYITASIIVQMASMVYPPWNQIRKDGESGRRKLMQYTRYGTVFLAAFQGFGAALAIQNSGGNLVPNRHRVDHHGHSVRDVAGRADYGARHRQRHHHDHRCGHHRRSAAGHRQYLGNGALG